MSLFEKIMKTLNALAACILVGASLVTAQTSRMMMPTVSSPSIADGGTELGANNTLTASGIALNNRVKMRGFVDFRYDYTNIDELVDDDDARFRTAADVDFLFDFSPVTGEVHFSASSGGVNLEQAFLRYNFNQDFSLTAGRQLTALGFEKDESPNMYQTSYAYLTDVSADLADAGGVDALKKFIGITSSSGSPGLTSAGTAIYNVTSSTIAPLFATSTFSQLPGSNVSVLDRTATTAATTTATIAAGGIYTYTPVFTDISTLTAFPDTLSGGTNISVTERDALISIADHLRNPTNPSDFDLPTFRRNYVDGVKLNFNNGQFGLTTGLHNGYFTSSEHLNDGAVGIDIAASVMIIPGLEVRVGFGYENSDRYNDSISPFNKWTSDLATAVGNLGTAYTTDANRIASQIFPESDDITQFNLWTSYQTGGLTLAFEWDLWNVYVIDMWNIMLLANYQFNDVFGLTFRYSHENFEIQDGVPGGGEGSSNRFTIGPMFSVTDNLTVGIEYSHAELDSSNTGDTSVDELYAETIFSF